MAAYELAQLNIAKLKAPVDSPVLVDFVANLQSINALADAAPGFVWRLQDDSGNATAIKIFGEQYIVNLTVWSDLNALHHYVYQTGHVEVMRRRKEWFEKMAEAHAALWWVPKGHVPSAAEAKAKLETLRAQGPSSEAFTFKQPFPAPGPENADSSAVGASARPDGVVA